MAKTPLRPTELQDLETLIDEHFPFDCNVIQIDPRTWAIHGTIPVGGDTLLAEYTTEEAARAALVLLRAAEQRVKIAQAR